MLLADARLQAAVAVVGPGLVRAAIQTAQELVRSGALPAAAAADAAFAALPASATTLRPVLNATGVVVHTNLGRAPLSAAAIEAVGRAAGYSDLEYDVVAGARSRRGRGTLAALLEAVPDAEDALVVNNGAAALVLATTALAAGREVVVSRGELVEIGDGFRLHELIASTGAVLREVGTTNRTALRDYAEAAGPAAGCVLKVHPSNFTVDGFTGSVTVAELASLGHPVVVDVGSGLLAPDPLLPAEPDVASALQAGAAVVTCSADKLLGGPQAGLLFGRAEVIERLRRHPLARALRVDKLTLAALEATLRGPLPPVPAALRISADELRRRCTDLADLVGGTVVPHDGAVGGGGAPGVRLPGWAVALPAAVAEPLRLGTPCVVGRVSQDRLLLDLRCVPAADDVALRDAVLAVLAR